MRVCLIFNPTAKGDRARRFVRRLETLGAACALKPTRAAGMARSLATQAVEEGFETIVAAGGDGTINEVINGIADAPEGLMHARLGVIPLGTANALAREYRLPRHVERAWSVLHEGPETAVDLLAVEFTADGKPQRRIVAQLAGAGVDARAVELVDWQLKKRWGWASYVIAGLRAVTEKHPPITANGGKHALTGEQVLIGNGRLYGGPFVVFPAADPRDGLLDVCVVPRVRWGTVFACCWGIVTNRLSRAGGAQHFQASTLTLAAPGRVPLELDGELVGELPARWSVMPRRLRLIVP